jgi:hypothetical protein
MVLAKSIHQRCDVELEQIKCLAHAIFWMTQRRQNQRLCKSWLKESQDRSVSSLVQSVLRSSPESDALGSWELGQQPVECPFQRLDSHLLHSTRKSHSNRLNKSLEYFVFAGSCLSRCFGRYTEHHNHKCLPGSRICFSAWKRLRCTGKEQGS